MCIYLDKKQHQKMFSALKVVFVSITKNKSSLNLKKLRIIVFGIICLIGITSAFAEECITPNSGAGGVCKTLRKCVQLKDTLGRRFNLTSKYKWNREQQHSPEMSNILKKYKICKVKKKVSILH